MHSADSEHQRFVRRLTAEGYIQSPSVEKAFSKIRRRDFLPEPLQARAYEDRAIAIQTRAVQGSLECTSSCSQPSLTAMMLELLDVQPGMRVLDVGTGSGYTSALLCELTGDDKTVESVDHDYELIEKAGASLEKYNFHPALHCGNALETFTSGTIYERMLVTAGAPYIPSFWCRQLGMQGILVVPYYWGGVDYLLKLVKTDEHSLRGRGICFTVFTGLDDTTRNERNSIIVYKKPDFLTLYDAKACLGSADRCPATHEKSYRKKSFYKDIAFENYHSLEGFHIFTLMMKPFSGYGLQLAYAESDATGFGGYGYYAITSGGEGLILIPQCSLGREIEVWGTGDALLNLLQDTYNHWKSLNAPAIGDFILTFDFQADTPEAAADRSSQAMTENGSACRITKNENRIYIELDPHFL